MNINAQPMKLSVILDKDVQYEIPTFQRSYSWKEKQVETLFNDIETEPSPYYVGNLLVDTSGEKERVLDGQQRLTTLSLILLATYVHMQRKLKDDQQELSDGLSSQLHEDIVYIKNNLRINDNRESRLTLLKRDQESWAHLLQMIDDPHKIPEGKGQYSLGKRFKFIFEKLFEGYDAPMLHNFYTDKLSKIEVLKIMTDDISDGYQVFSSFNGKGIPLTPLDLVKGIYFSQRGSLESKWEQLTEIFTDGDRADESKMTRFVLNNYDAFESESTSSLTKSKIVSTYENLFNKYGTNYIEELINRAKNYREIDNDDDFYRYDLSGLDKLDATTSYPLVLNLLVNKKQYELSDDQFNQIIRVLINFYIRRNYVLTPKASNLRSSLNGLRLRISSGHLLGEELVQVVQNKVGELTPSDTAFIEAIKNGVYDVNKKTTRFILIALERKFGANINMFNKSNPDSLDAFDGKNLRWTIEHIIPQGDLKSSYWINVLGNGDAEVAQAEQSKNVHRLGNLTLTPYNSEMSQKPFREKVDLYDEDSETFVGLKAKLYLNTTIDEDAEYFNVESIDQREALLVDKLLELLKSVD
ncbi:DUF262 domain-containing protein [Fructobacillus ficulneus]|uniref:Type I restriction-modification system DNA methylase n=1 Tax=Fructobacillus ficulneus TaxID=157463 RepID=A0A0K8MJ63_9LACO|nr:DUF262 domain-containing protein [Fructobacillus ficulneus]GAO99924.1 type I restriction-modification system DNA methylase [Fructobacillus ficulneus]